MAPLFGPTFAGMVAQVAAMIGPYLMLLIPLLLFGALLFGVVRQLLAIVREIVSTGPISGGFIQHLAFVVLVLTLFSATATAV